MKSFTRTAAVMKAYRQKLGLTQLAIAKPLGLHSQFWSNAERGMCLLPIPQMKEILSRKDFNKQDFIEALREDLIESHMQKYYVKRKKSLRGTVERK